MSSTNPRRIQRSEKVCAFQVKKAIGPDRGQVQQTAFYPPVHRCSGA